MTRAGNSNPRTKPRIRAPKALSRRYRLRLYVSGATPRSLQAVESIKRICETHLKGRYELSVVDMYQQPQLARKEQILASPTLIKLLPRPLRRFIGDMANTRRILIGLDVVPCEPPPGQV
jgi:circadian clock protein KaiB